MFGGSVLREQQWNYFEYGFGALLAWIETASGTNDRIVSHGLEQEGGGSGPPWTAATSA